MSRSVEISAAAIDEVVRAVSGVGELFYASALPARLWHVGTGRANAYSSVVVRGGIPEIAVSIGVAAGRADEVARRVAEAVGTAARTATGGADAQVTVRVSRISAHEPR